jgi:hypothetical protein
MPLLQCDGMLLCGCDIITVFIFKLLFFKYWWNKMNFKKLCRGIFDKKLIWINMASQCKNCGKTHKLEKCKNHKNHKNGWKMNEATVEEFKERLFIHLKKTQKNKNR